VNIIAIQELTTDAGVPLNPDRKRAADGDIGVAASNVPLMLNGRRISLESLREPESGKAPRDGSP